MRIMIDERDAGSRRSADASQLPSPIRMLDGLQMSGTSRGHEQREFHPRRAPVLGRSMLQGPVAWADPSSPGLRPLLRPGTGALQVARGTSPAFGVHPPV